MNNNPLKIDDDTKNVILEASALSGYAQNVTKEVLQYLLFDWAIKIADHPDEYATLTIPYIGNLNVKFAGDKVTTTGELETKVDCFMELSDSFKKLIGDIHDEGYTALVPMALKIIEQAVMVASTPNE